VVTPSIMADYTVDRDMQYPAVTMAIRRLAKRLETNKALAKKVKRVERMLFVKGLLPNYLSHRRPQRGAAATKSSSSVF
jgi:hypothetical protein